MAWCDVVERRTLRECRIALGQSQVSFAAMLGASLESYRTWDAGRRATSPKILARARALATHRDDHALLPLPVLALLIGVHVKTLRAAARDGRLPVTYDTRTTFRRLRARATPAAARAFRRSYFGRTVRPADCRARGLSQAQLAALVGAARKAVVYQWEARKRTPSPVFWQRIAALLAPAIRPSTTDARTPGSSLSRSLQLSAPQRPVPAAGSSPASASTPAPEPISPLETSLS